MSDINEQEKYIVELLAQNGGIMNYKDMQHLCEDKFEGLRLVLKKLKDKGYVTYDGMIPGLSAEIELIKKIF